MNTEKPLAKKQNIVVQELPDELLIYDLTKDKAYCLNKTSAFVWKTSDGTNDVNAITKLMEKEFNSSVNEDLVWLALDQFAKDELLEVKPNNKFNNLSRREVIRRVGLASVIALPVVASLVAPSAVLAVTCSGAPNGQICSGCGSNNCVCCNGVCKNGVNCNA